MRHPSFHLPDGRTIAEGLAGALSGIIAGGPGSSRPVPWGGRTFATATARSTASDAAATPSVSIATWPAGLIPVFRGRAILVDFDPSVNGQAHVVMAGLQGLISLLDRRGATDSELLASIPSFVAQYRLNARFVARTREAIAFRVMPHEAYDADPDVPMWI